VKVVEIVCPDCGKIITKVSDDSNVVIYGYCRRCKEEKKIKYISRAKEPLKK
jgi:DNA-directed RNA polymerase subunit M/transcription elongation factor TFIIS